MLKTHFLWKLEGLTEKGIGLIKEHGKWWHVIDPTNYIPETKLKYLKSCSTGKMRWESTLHFKIVDVIEK